MRCKGTHCPACREERRNEWSDSDYSDEGIGILDGNSATYLDGGGGGVREPNCKELVVEPSNDAPDLMVIFLLY